MYCRQCGSQVNRGDNFCTNCGEKIVDDNPSLNEQSVSVAQPALHNPDVHLGESVKPNSKLKDEKTLAPEAPRLPFGHIATAKPKSKGEAAYESVIVEEIVKVQLKPSSKQKNEEALAQQTQQLPFGHKTTAKPKSEASCDASAADEIPAAHPWRRFFARTVDIYTFGIGLYLLTVFLFFSLVPVGEAGELLELVSNPIFGAILMYFLWLPFEALFISQSGYTPGKWLFGIKILNMKNETLAFGQAMERSLLAMVKGAGLSIPIVSIITKIIAYSRLKEVGITSWDEDTGSCVFYSPLSTARVIGCVLILMVVLVMLIVLVAIGNATSV